MEYISLGKCLSIKIEFFLQGSAAFDKLQHWIKRWNQSISVRTEDSTSELLEFPFMMKHRIAVGLKHLDYIKMEYLVYPDVGPFPVFLFSFQFRPKEIHASGIGNLTSKQILVRSLKKCPRFTVTVNSDDREVTRTEQWNWRLTSFMNVFQCLVCSSVS